MGAAQNRVPGASGALRAGRAERLGSSNRLNRYSYYWRTSEHIAHRWSASQFHEGCSRPECTKGARACGADSYSHRSALRRQHVRRILPATGHFRARREPGSRFGYTAKQTAEIMIRLEPIVLERQPDIVLVYGDVNWTVSTALVCAKLGVRIGHVEAGLRSFDRTMPEEINRLVTDQLADMLFTPSEDGDENLLREGVPAEKIFRVGNVMIDSLMRLLPAAQKTS